MLNSPGMLRINLMFAENFLMYVEIFMYVRKAHPI